MSNKSKNIFDSVSPMKGDTVDKSETKTEEKVEVAPEKEIKVVAIFEGYLHPKRIDVGTEFMVPVSKFSKRWMQIVEEAKIEEKE